MRRSVFPSLSTAKIFRCRRFWFRWKSQALPGSAPFSSSGPNKDLNSSTIGAPLRQKMARATAATLSSLLLYTWSGRFVPCQFNFDTYACIDGTLD